MTRDESNNDMNHAGDTDAGLPAELEAVGREVDLDAERLRAEPGDRFESTVLDRMLAELTPAPIPIGRGTAASNSWVVRVCAAAGLALAAGLVAVVVTRTPPAVPVAPSGPVALSDSDDVSVLSVADFERGLDDLLIVEELLAASFASAMPDSFDDEFDDDGGSVWDTLDLLSASFEEAI